MTPRGRPRKPPPEPEDMLFCGVDELKRYYTKCAARQGWTPQQALRLWKEDKLDTDFPADEEIAALSKLLMYGKWIGAER